MRHTCLACHATSVSAGKTVRVRNRAGKTYFEDVLSCVPMSIHPSVRPWKKRCGGTDGLCIETSYIKLPTHQIPFVRKYGGNTELYPQELDNLALSSLSIKNCICNAKSSMKISKCRWYLGVSQSQSVGPRTYTDFAKTWHHGISSPPDMNNTFKNRTTFHTFGWISACILLHHFGRFTENALFCMIHLFLSQFTKIRRQGTFYNKSTILQQIHYFTNFHRHYPFYSKSTVLQTPAAMIHFTVNVNSWVHVHTETSQKYDIAVFLSHQIWTTLSKPVPLFTHLDTFWLIHNVGRFTENVMLFMIPLFVSRFINIRRHCTFYNKITVLQRSTATVHFTAKANPWVHVHTETSQKSLDMTSNRCLFVNRMISLRSPNWYIPTAGQKFSVFLGTFVNRDFVNNDFESCMVSFGKRACAFWKDGCMDFGNVNCICWNWRDHTHRTNLLLTLLTYGCSMTWWLNFSVPEQLDRMTGTSQKMSETYHFDEKGIRHLWSVCARLSVNKHQHLVFSEHLIRLGK